jgi:hypothetical protein
MAALTPFSRGIAIFARATIEKPAQAAKWPQIYPDLADVAIAVSAHPAAWSDAKQGIKGHRR